MSTSARAQTHDAKRPARPRDPNQLAHLLLGEATREREFVPGPAAVATAEPAAPATKPQRRPKKAAAKVAAGRLGGLASAAARVEKISPERRKEIAAKAAAARWAKET